MTPSIPTPEEVAERIAMRLAMAREAHFDTAAIPFHELETLLSTLQAQASEIEGLKAESADLTKALTGLTCGGSEFFVRKGERFVADIPACVAWVRRSKEGAHKRTYEAVKAKQALQSALDEALGALKVFRSVARLIDSNWYNGRKDDRSTFRSGLAWVENGIEKTLTIGDFRRAFSLYDRLKGRTGA